MENNVYNEIENKDQNDSIENNLSDSDESKVSSVDINLLDFVKNKIIKKENLNEQIYNEKNNIIKSKYINTGKETKKNINHLYGQKVNIIKNLENLIQEYRLIIKFSLR